MAIPKVTKIDPLAIFVFGSNEAGIHGAGAARDALDFYGAKWGMGYGLQGISFAIPTKGPTLRTLPLFKIREYVDRFLTHAAQYPNKSYKITAIGTGLAGIHAQDIAPMFKNATENCYFDTVWYEWLGDSIGYWGTF